MLISPIFSVLSAVVVAIHSYLNLFLCKSLSDKTRFHKSSIYITCLVNGLLSPLLFSVQYNNPMTFYFICIAVIILEFAILYVGKFTRKLGVALGSLLHLFVLRAIIVAAVAIYYNISMAAVIFNLDLFSLVNLGSFVAQIVSLTLFILLIPLKTVRRIMADKAFYKSLLSLTLLLTIYITYNAYIFLIDTVSFNLAVQEIVISVFILLFFYIMMLLLIRIFNLGIYKEKSLELEDKIDQDKILTSAVFNYAIIIIEINCTKDYVKRVLVNSTEVPLDQVFSVEDFFKLHTTRLTHPDDFEKMSSISASSLLFDFENGFLERTIEFRSKKIELSANTDITNSSNNDYMWYRMRLNTHLDEESSEVFALLTVDEIHDEKQEELALRYRADRDSLTGAYNKSAFAKKINEYLQSGGQGAFYMFDLDNFKGINDNMGHTLGDSVLCEVYSKITSLFRKQDLVGRIGGDEFVVFLVDSSDLTLAQEKAQHICNTLNKTYHSKNELSITISCSVGISIAPKDGTNFESLFNAADFAMYHSKNKGKNTFTFYTPDLANEDFPKAPDTSRR